MYTPICHFYVIDKLACECSVARNAELANVSMKDSIITNSNAAQYIFPNFRNIKHPESMVQWIKHIFEIFMCFSIVR